MLFSVLGFKDGSFSVVARNRSVHEFEDYLRRQTDKLGALFTTFEYTMCDDNDGIESIDETTPESILIAFDAIAYIDRVDGHSLVVEGSRAADGVSPVPADPDA